MIRALILAVLFQLPFPCLGGEMDPLIDAFANIRTDATWPVQGGSFNDIEETFGPRRQPSAGGRYDWHRGIDIDEAGGTNIVAALAGEFNRYTNYAAGGWTVVLKHTFPEPIQFRGKTVRNFYTFYMHLDDAGAPAYIKEAQANGAHPAIARGQLIGLMGNTGEGPGGEYNTHLHFELRVGSLSSLEFQLDNFDPASTSFYGFDPHLHPMLLFEPGSPVISFELNHPLLPGFSTTNLVTLSDDDFPILNRLEVELLSDAGERLNFHALDLNLRDGFDASSTAALDTVDAAKPHLAPLYFTDAQTNYQTQLVVPAAFLAPAISAPGAQVRFTAFDLWGRPSSLTFPVGAPRLEIAFTPPNIRLQLPLGYSRPQVETIPAFEPGAIWAPFAAPETSPGVLETATVNPQSYFRLRWPLP